MLNWLVRFMLKQLVRYIIASSSSKQWLPACSPFIVITFCHLLTRFVLKRPCVVDGTLKSKNELIHNQSRLPFHCEKCVFKRVLFLKAYTTGRHRWARRRIKCMYRCFHLQASFGCSINIYPKVLGGGRILLLLRTWTLRDATMFVWSFFDERSKKVDSWCIFDAFALHSGLGCYLVSVQSSTFFLFQRKSCVPHMNNKQTIYERFTVKECAGM